MTVIRKSDGSLLVGFSVVRAGLIGCGARRVDPGDDDYPRLRAQAIDEAEWEALADPDHPDNVRARAYFRARQRAEEQRDFAVRLGDERLLLPEQYWWEPYLLPEIGPDHPDYARWARTAISDEQWHRQWWRGARPGR